VRDLDGLILVRDLGCSRCGASATVAILEEYHRRAEEEQKGAANAVAGSKAHIGAGGC
jgi:deoxyribose-phosphate aldolase